jgi:hypothetical protein
MKKLLLLAIAAGAAYVVVSRLRGAEDEVDLSVSENGVLAHGEDARRAVGEAAGQLADADA